MLLNWIVSVIDKTEDIRTILGSIRQGICTISKTALTIDPEFSRFMSDLFPGVKIHGNRLPDILLSKSSLNHDQQSQVVSVLKACLGETELTFECNIHLLPQELTISNRETTKILDLDWYPVLDEQSHLVKKIILAIRDVTVIKILQEEARVANEEMNYVLEIVRIGEQKFQTALKACMSFVEDSFSILDSDQDHEEKVESLFRNIHTLKGTARPIKCIIWLKTSYYTEQMISGFQSKERPFDGELIRKELEKVKEELGKYTQVNHDRLGHDIAYADEVVIPRSMVEFQLKVISNPAMLQLKGLSRRQVRQARALLFKVIYNPLHVVLKDLIESTETIANELGRIPPEIHIDEANVGYRKEAHGLLRNTFVHIFRNALDHGIETPNERVVVGKNPKGYIEIQEIPGKKN